MSGERTMTGPRLDLENGRIEMIHGNGGRASAKLVEEILLPAFDNEWLHPLGDQARFDLPGGRFAMTTDSYVISPLFFPGGDIGSLAVHGTVNDLAMGGAQPLYLTTGFILEEGFPLSDLVRIVRSMAMAAKNCGAALVAGDTKVVERGKGDGIYINTAGIGQIPDGLTLDPSGISPGDVLLISGTIGDHGAAVLAAREGFRLASTLRSDSAPLHSLVQTMMNSGPGLVCLRDPTRGGVASTLNEWARTSGLPIEIREEGIPVREEVRGVSELLGIDPLYLANEGKLLAVCRPEAADRILSAMKTHPLGYEAARIGMVGKNSSRIPVGGVLMKTLMGGTRMVDWLLGDPLPRIC